MKEFERFIVVGCLAVAVGCSVDIPEADVTADTAPGVVEDELGVLAPVSCTNDQFVAGKNRVLFPVANGAGNYNRAPVYCAGDFTVNTTDGNYTSSCSTGWKTVANTWTASCVDAYCTGNNRTVFPVANARGKNNVHAYKCFGFYWIDTRGSNYSSYCSTGWERVQNLGCGKPAYSPSYWNDGGGVQNNNNAYNYATNKRGPKMATPGVAAGYPKVGFIPCHDGSGSTPDFFTRIEADGLVRSTREETCPDGTTKIAAECLEWLPPSYHFYRQDADGLWSEKHEAGPVTRHGNGSDPGAAIERDHGYTLRYYCACSDPEQGMGHTAIR